MNKKRRMPALLSIMGEGEHKEDGEGESSPGELHEIAHELIEGIHSRNVGDVVAAFKAAFACCENEPHEEYGEE